MRHIIPWWKHYNPTDIDKSMRLRIPLWRHKFKCQSLSLTARRDPRFRMTDCWLARRDLLHQLWPLTPALTHTHELTLTDTRGTVWGNCDVFRPTGRSVGLPQSTQLTQFTQLLVLLITSQESQAISHSWSEFVTQISDLGVGLYCNCKWVKLIYSVFVQFCEKCSLTAC